MDVERDVKFDVPPLVRQTCFYVTSRWHFCRYAPGPGENVSFADKHAACTLIAMGNRMRRVCDKIVQIQGFKDKNTRTRIIAYIFIQKCII